MVTVKYFSILRSSWVADLCIKHNFFSVRLKESMLFSHIFEMSPLKSVGYTALNFCQHHKPSVSLSSPAKLVVERNIL